MRPYYSADGIEVYHGDFRSFYPLLNGAALVLTDIPYGEVNRASGGLRNLDKGGADVETMLPYTVAEAIGARMAGSAYVFCGTEQVSDLRRGFVATGCSTRLGIWEKSNPSPMNGEALWLSSLECCVFARKPKATFNEFCASPVWRGPTDFEDWGHATPKPRWLMERLILASTKPGDLVCDPFMGCGTTLRAAKDLGRRAIGIDLNESHCQTAVERLSQQVLAL